MKRALVIAVLAVALSSCLSVESEISLDENGSGSIDLLYTIDRDFYELGVFDDSDVALAIPLAESEFREAVRLHSGLRLRRYRKREEESVVMVEVRLDFDSVAALSAWYGGSAAGENAIGFRQTDEEAVWRQMLSPGGGGSDEIAVGMGESLEGFRLSYTLRTPREIVSVSSGEIASNGRSATVSVSLEEIVRATEPLYWDVRW